MKTNETFKKNLNNGILTEEMLELCLFSVNKRAKNCRDKKNEYIAETNERRFFNRYYYDKYDNVGKYTAKMEEYYEMKDKLLTLLDPICIHKELFGYEKRKIYDYEPEYKRVKYKDIVRDGRYFDEDRDDLVEFIVVEDKTKPIYHYYNFYKTSNYSFHTPLQDFNEEDPSKLEIKEITKIESDGRDVEILLSVQFVKKVISMLEENKLKYIH